MNLLCGKCQKECAASAIRVCSDCGSFYCEDCATAHGDLCPSCWGRLDRLS